MKSAVSKGSDWELDFYSRPILDADGRKRWELLITTTPSSEDGDTPFRFAKVCPSSEVNSIWLNTALAEAREHALQEGYGAPVRLPSHNRLWNGRIQIVLKTPFGNPKKQLMHAGFLN